MTLLASKGLEVNEVYDKENFFLYTNSCSNKCSYCGRPNKIELLKAPSSSR